MKKMNRITIVTLAVSATVTFASIAEAAKPKSAVKKTQNVSRKVIEMVRNNRQALRQYPGHTKRILRILENAENQIQAQVRQARKKAQKNGKVRPPGPRHGYMVWNAVQVPQQGPRGCHGPNVVFSPAPGVRNGMNCGPQIHQPCYERGRQLKVCSVGPRGRQFVSCALQCI